MANSPIESIGIFFALFAVAIIIQHIMMTLMYRWLFLKLTLVPIIGDVFNRPAVIIHEFFGHLIPAIISGSNIIGINLHEERGQVSVKYEKNIFGMASVFIAGFGPTFILPFIFIGLLIYLNSYDAVGFFSSHILVKNFFEFVSDISMMDELKDVLLLYAAVVLAPGAASSAGDLRSVIEFVKNAKGMVLIGSLVAIAVMYISYIEGFKISDYGIIIVQNTLTAYIMIYIFALLVIILVVYGWLNKAYLESIFTLIAIFILSIMLVPSFRYPLILGLIAADGIALLKGVTHHH
ncbi:MAG: hypothetical protein ACP5KJ_03060 [Candidatus Micrarchaeia archaeon]